MYPALSRGALSKFQATFDISELSMILQHIIHHTLLFLHLLAAQPATGDCLNFRCGFSRQSLRCKHRSSRVVCQILKYHALHAHLVETFNFVYLPRPHHSAGAEIRPNIDGVSCSSHSLIHARSDLLHMMLHQYAFLTMATQTLLLRKVSFRLEMRMHNIDHSELCIYDLHSATSAPALI